MSSKAAARRARGFTLIEMIVLIVIIAIVSSIAVPAYHRLYARSKFDSAVENVSDLLAWAHDRAVQSGGRTVVRFDAQSGTLAAVAESPPASASEPAALERSTESAAQQMDRSTSLPEDVVIREFQVMSATPNPTGQQQVSGEIAFAADGSADGAQIGMLSADGYAALLEVVPTTGRVVVTDATQGGTG